MNNLAVGVLLIGSMLISCGMVAFELSHFSTELNIELTKSVN